MTRFKKTSAKDFLINNAIIIILILLSITATFVNPRFLSVSNFKNIGINSAPRFLIALGVSGCLITRGTDLSAGRMVGLGACIAGTMLQGLSYGDRFFPYRFKDGIGSFTDFTSDNNMFLVLLLVIAVCAIFGFINGMVISKLKVPPFIATLGMQTIVYGVALLYTNSKPLGGYRKDYTGIGTSRLLGIPTFVFIAIVAGILMWVLYNKTTHGKHMYAIGGNPQAAEVSGVKVDRSVIIIYTLAACLYGFAGFLLGAKSAGATVNTGQGYELEAIASCTIGGVSTHGGVGNISGILIGVLVFEILKTSLQFLNVPSDFQYIVQGFVIIIAVALDLRKYLVRK